MLKTLTIKALYLLLFLAITPLILGFLSALHPLFDSFGHFRIHLFLVVLSLLFALAVLHNKKTYRYFYFLIIFIGGSCLYASIQPFNQTSQIKNNKTLKLVQFNLSFRNKQMIKFQHFLSVEMADVVTLQEVTSDHRFFLRKLKKEYPYQEYCVFAGIGDVAILSKYPFNKNQGQCLKGEGLLISQIIIAGKPINIISIHLHWPFPYKQQEQVTKIVNVLKTISDSKIIAGDFNAASWSHTIKRISQASKTAIVPGIRWSLNFRKIPLLPIIKLPIDHLLVSGDFTVKQIYMGKAMDSDHLPIISNIEYSKN